MRFEQVLTSQYLVLWGEGLITSLFLLFSSLFFGGVCALGLAMLRVSSKPWLSLPVWCFTYVVRGTPLLIQVYLIYYGIAQADWIQAQWSTETMPWIWLKYPLFCAVFAFAINTCAYTTEIVAGAMRETANGEIEAAKAMGFTSRQTLYRLVLPSALRRSLPSYSNEVIWMFHGTALASVVPSLLDITGVANEIKARFYLPFEPYIVAGVIYLMVSFVLVALFKLLERRYLAYLEPRSA